MAKPVASHLEIEGMHCGGCVTRVTAALKRLSGVEVKSVDVGSADITASQPLSEPELAEAIAKAGFTLKTVVS